MDSLDFLVFSLTQEFGCRTGLLFFSLGLDLGYFRFIGFCFSWIFGQSIKLSASMDIQINDTKIAIPSPFA